MKQMIVLVTLSLGLGLTACASNDRRDDDRARELAAEERGRRDAENEALRREQVRRDRGAIGIGGIPAQPLPGVQNPTGGLVR